MNITVLQLHKRSSYEFKHIQDKYAINSDTKTFALADGTTQSFKSEIWAEIITKGFVNNPSFNPNTIINAFTKQVAEYKSLKIEFSSNPAKASLEKAKQNKGGTATFIGLKFTTENKIELISCGDTNLFILNSDNKSIAFPFSDVDSLDANNNFINTEQLTQNKIDETFFKLKSIQYKPDDKIIVATDALSRLILKKTAVLSEILKIENFNQFNDFCLKYWEGKELEEDDISAIIIPAQNSGYVEIIHPPTDFSFPKEKEVEFIPTSLQPKSKKDYIDMEMNEIRNQFNGVAQDFHQVKKKLKLHEILLMITISLLMVNIFLIFFFRPKNSKDETIKITGKSESVFNQKYENKIKDLKPKNQILSKEEAKKRQELLIEADYDVSADGIWGTQSEKIWNEYQKKKKHKN